MTFKQEAGLRPALLRLLHRIVDHRYEPCTLIDLFDNKYTGRRCRCGAIDDEAWMFVGPRRGMGETHEHAEAVTR